MMPRRSYGINSDNCTPVLTIITITLNDEVGLSNTLQSVVLRLNKSQDVQHIIIDGDSNYDVASVINAHNSNASLYQKKDSGIYDAMNRGIKHANGKYVWFLNGGDTLAHDLNLGLIVSILKHQMPDFLYGDSYELNYNGELTKKLAMHHNYALATMFTHHQSMIFRTEIIKKHRIEYDLSYSIASDYLFVLNFLEHCQVIQKVDVSMCQFLSGGLSENNASRGRFEQFQIRHQYTRSFFYACKIYVIQYLTLQLRKFSPNAYRFIKNILNTNRYKNGL